VTRPTRQVLLLTVVRAVQAQPQLVNHPLARVARVVLIRSEALLPLRLAVAVAQLVMVATQHRQAFQVAAVRVQATLSQAQRYPMAVVAAVVSLLMLERLALVLMAAATVGLVIPVQPRQARTA